MSFISHSRERAEQYALDRTYAQATLCQFYTLRKDSGLTLDKLGEILAPVWGCAPSSIRTIIRLELERGAYAARLRFTSIFTRRIKELKSQELSQRLSDYSCLLGLPDEEAEFLLSPLAEINQSIGWRVPSSLVVPFRKCSVSVKTREELSRLSSSL